MAGIKLTPFPSGSNLVQGTAPIQATTSPKVRLTSFPVVKPAPVQPIAPLKVETSPVISAINTVHNVATSMGDAATNTLLNAANDFVYKWTYNELTAHSPLASNIEKASATGRALLSTLNTAFAPASALIQALTKAPIVGKVGEGINTVFDYASQAAKVASKNVVSLIPASEKDKKDIQNFTDDLFSTITSFAVGIKGAKIVQELPGRLNKAVADSGEKVTPQVVKDAAVKVVDDLKNEIAQPQTLPPIVLPQETPKVSTLPTEILPTPEVPTQTIPPELQTLAPGKIEGYQVGKPQKYKIIEAGNKIKTIKGEPVKIIDGIDTFIHQGDGGWIVSEASTGRYISESRTKGAAIAKADMAISLNENKFRQALNEKKLSKISSPQLPVRQTIETKPSKIGLSIEAKAIEAKITEGFKNTAQYDPTTVPEQAKLSTDIVNKGETKIKAILRAEESLPDRVNPAYFIKTVEEYLSKNPSEDLAYELANSPLVSGTSTAAQTLRFAAERNPESALARVIEVKKFYEAKAARATKTTSSDVSKTLTKELGKVNIELKWQNFLNEIIC